MPHPLAPNPTAQHLYFDSSDEHEASDSSDSTPAYAHRIVSDPSFRFYDSSSDDEMTSTTPQCQYISRSAAHGDPRAYMKAFMKQVRCSRMSDWNLEKQAYACSSHCDNVTEKTIHDLIEADANSFPFEGRNMLFKRGALAMNALAPAVADMDARIGTLQQFA